MTLTHKELVDVLKHLEESSCEEFRLHINGVELMLRRRVARAEPAPSQPEAPTRPTAAPEDAPATPVQVEKPGAAREASGAEGEVLAPMSGTFYRRPSPDAPPFVEVGSEVRAGDPVCMIEVMKLFSTIYAEIAGRVVAIEVDDAGAVQQGQVLMVIEPGAG